MIIAREFRLMYTVIISEGTGWITNALLVVVFKLDVKIAALMRFLFCVLIFRWLWIFFSFKPPVRRLWVSFTKEDGKFLATAFSQNFNRTKTLSFILF